MGKIFSYITIAIFFFSTTGLSQLFKLPVLLTHYWEHKERDRSIDMLDFLSMHYWGQDINDNDHDRDMRLPFKSVEQSSVTSVVLVHIQQVSIEGPGLPVHSIQPEISDTDHSDPALSALFRPPRA